jgi:putative membrane protein
MSLVLVRAHGGAGALVLPAALVLLAVTYLLSWWRADASDQDRLPRARLWAFLAGLGTLWVAVGPVLGHLDQGYLTAHMVQHLLLMTVAAPLLLLGEPARVLGGGFRPGGGRSPARVRAPHPLLCWFAGTGIVLFWHVPGLFELGMRWHALQHATFLVAGLLFWIPVIRPWPMVSRWPRWSIPAYLFLATLPCDALSAFLAFCGRVVYQRYCFTGGLGISALDDQVRAGALMWFWVTIAYLVPAALETIDLLSPRRTGLVHVPRWQFREGRQADEIDVIKANS